MHGSASAGALRQLGRVAAPRMQAAAGMSPRQDSRGGSPRSDAHHDRLPPAGSPRAGGRTEPPTAAAAALAPAAAPTSRGAPSTDAADPVPEPELPREAPAAAAASATTTTTAAPASASATATATATAASATSTAASATAAPSAAGAPAAPQRVRAAAVAFAAGLWHCPEQAARDVQAQVGAAAALAEYVLARAKCKPGLGLGCLGNATWVWRVAPLRRMSALLRLGSPNAGGSS